MGQPDAEATETAPADTGGAAWQSRLPVPPRKRGRQSRDRIVAAAAELIDEHGVRSGKVSVRAIAAAAGVSIGAIYHHFVDLDQIVTAVAEQYMREMTDAIRQVHAGWEWTDWTEMVDASLDRHAAFFRDRPGLRDLWFDEHAAPGVVDIHLDHRAYIAEDLRRRFLALTGRDLSPVTHQIAIAISESLFELAFRLDPAGSPDVLAELREVFRDYYRRHLEPRDM
jgi:AcrR family transcriptional regulator